MQCRNLGAQSSYCILALFRWILLIIVLVTTIRSRHIEKEKIKKKSRRRSNTGAGLCYCRSSFNQQLEKGGFGPAANCSCSNLSFASGSVGRRTSPALAFPLMSASSSLSSSLSFLMQSKYSFCLSRAWPHTWEKTWKTGEEEEEEQKLGRLGRDTRHHMVQQDQHALCTQQANSEDRNKWHTQTGRGCMLTAGCWWETWGGVGQQTGDTVSAIKPWCFHHWRLCLDPHKWADPQVETCMSCYNICPSFRADMEPRTTQCTAGFNTVSVHLCIVSKKPENLLFQHAKIQTVNVDWSGYAQKPEGHHQAETASELYAPHVLSEHPRGTPYPNLFVLPVYRFLQVKHLSGEGI